MYIVLSDVEYKNNFIKIIRNFKFFVYKDKVKNCMLKKKHKNRYTNIVLISIVLTRIACRTIRIILQGLIEIVYLLLLVQLLVHHNHNL
ncbi:hypothetical protein BpHYR1_040028 [Brachionus plicatilis]|uniref:Uncharacterized protein n=1 Tax=Brachionus plicatilis TaxID=10195 RepID=A0A3M7T1A5_BRAPC|nr:hypothetical protein BpHYR1_040028 [Brachionus plicatilis]